MGARPLEGAVQPERAPLTSRWRLVREREGVAVLGAVAAATLLGAVLRFATLGRQSFWADEGVTVTLAKKSLGAMLSTIPHTESTPPLYYVFEWVWVRLFGTSEVGARSLSALVGTLTIPIAYAAARRLLDRTLPAVAVAVFAAVNPVLVWYSQEARSYALYAFFDAVALLFLARAMRDASRRNLWGWAAASALAVCTHYFGGFFAIATAAVLVHRLRRRALVPAVVALAPGALLLPLAKYQLDHQNASSWISGSSLGYRVQEVAQRFTMLFYTPGQKVTVALAVAICVYLAWRARRLAGARVAAAVVALGAGIPLALAAAGLVDVFYYRNLLALWLPLAILVAAGLPSTRLGAVAVLVLALPPLASTVRTASDVALQRDSWRTAVASLKTLPGSRVVVSDYLDEPYVLPLYWPTLEKVGPRGVSVSEIDMVGHYLNAKSAIAALPAFRPSGTIAAGNLTIVRLRASAPQRVRSGSLPAGGGLLARG